MDLTDAQWAACEAAAIDELLRDLDDAGRQLLSDALDILIRRYTAAHATSTESTTSPWPATD